MALITRGRRTIATIVVIVTAVLAFAALLWFLIPSDQPRYEALFAADHTEESWPPVAPTSLADELAETEAMRRIGLAGLVLDAEVPAQRGATPGLMVRTSTAQGLYYIEAVFGRDVTFDDPMPMAMLIHGRGDRARIPGGPFWGLDTPLRVIVPQAPDPLGNGFEWLPVRVGQNLVDRLTTSLMARAAQLASLLRQLMTDLPTAGRALVVGFSQGGLLTFTLATHYPDVVSAAFPLAAWLPPALVPPYARDVFPYPRIRGVHGTADTVIPLGPTEELYDTLSGRGLDAELLTFDGVAHEMSEDMNTQLHEWLREALVGVVEAGIAEGVLDGGMPPCEPYPSAWPPSLDGGVPEAGPFDGGWPEAGWPEAGWPEAGVPEGWPMPCPDPDAGILEAGVPEAGVPDAD